MTQPTHQQLNALALAAYQRMLCYPPGHHKAELHRQAARALLRAAEAHRD